MAAFISDQDLERIRSASDVVEVIGSYFPLKRAGANFRALCPFHKEKTPSFNVHPAKQIWHCFGCGAGGDVFTFVMKYENLDFTSAVMKLAERTGITIQTVGVPGGSGPTRSERERLFKLHEDAATHYHGLLLRSPSAQVARDYLKKRNISMETAVKWRIGYSLNSWDGLIQWAQQRGIDTMALEKAGLVLRSERADTGTGFYDRFRGRLMFPICDEQSRVAGFSARILTNDKDQPKYVNSPETPIFQKSKILFGLHKAKQSILNEKFAIICEGQIDTISCHEAGVENVVAPQGTAFTDHHARMLKRYTDEIVLMFDSDSAGQNAATRSIEPLLDMSSSGADWTNVNTLNQPGNVFATGLAIRIAVLPSGHDPDSLIKSEGAGKLRQLVTNAPSFLVYLLDRLLSQHDASTDRGKLQIAKQMMEWVSRVPNTVLQATYVRQTAQTLDVPEGAVLQELKRATSGRRPQQAEEELVGADSIKDDGSKSNAAETILLQMMLTDARVVEQAAGKVKHEWLESGSPAARLIVNTISLYEEGRWNGPTTLLNEADEEDSKFISGLLMNPSVSGDVCVASGDCIRTIEKKYLEKQLRELRNRLASGTLTVAEVVSIQQQALDLRTKLDNISRLSAGTRRG
jgi:DNA primase